MKTIVNGLVVVFVCVSVTWLLVAPCSHHYVRGYTWLVLGPNTSTNTPSMLVGTDFCRRCGIVKLSDEFNKLYADKIEKGLVVWTKPPATIVNPPKLMSK